MKFSANFIIAMLAYLAAFVEASTNGLILRALDATDGLFPACATDADFIGKELIKIDNGAPEILSDDGGRALRTTRELQTSYCRNVCRGFMPGMCRYVYPQCKGMRRRNLKSNNNNKRVQLEEDHTLVCASLILAIHDAVLKLADQVDPACAAELLAPKEFKCFRIIQN